MRAPHEVLRFRRPIVLHDPVHTRSGVAGDQRSLGLADSIFPAGYLLHTAPYGALDSHFATC